MSKYCMFCGDKIEKSKNKAKEHVLKNSWLKNLGHQKTELEFGLHNSENEIVEVRRMVADALQCGEVCKKCNNGWMNDLDNSIEHVVLGLARRTLSSVNLNKRDRWNLGRWILKTACTFIYMDKPHRRHIPKEVLRSMKERKYLPEGFSAFYTVFPKSQIGVHAASIDAWQLHNEKKNRILKSCHRLKFGVQYNNVMIGCCYISYPNPCFVGIDGLHIPLTQNKARFLTLPPPRGFILPEKTYYLPINIFVASLDVELSA